MILGVGRVVTVEGARRDLFAGRPRRSHVGQQQ
jgi:hypothetical protein